VVIRLGREREQYSQCTSPYKVVLQLGTEVNELLETFFLLSWRRRPTRVHLLNEFAMSTLCERDVAAVLFEIEDEEPNNACTHE